MNRSNDGGQHDFEAAGCNAERQREFELDHLAIKRKVMRSVTIGDHFARALDCREIGLPVDLSADDPPCRQQQPRSAALGDGEQGKLAVLQGRALADAAMPGILQRLVAAGAATP